MSDIRKTFYVGYKSDGSYQKRPMSPHLQVYKPVLSMILSIGNRITGGMLSAASILMVAWLVSAAKGPEAFDKIQKTAKSFPGQCVLFGSSAAFFLHFISRIRHFIWDLNGNRLEKSEINQDSKAEVIGIATLTLALWTIILGKRLRKRKH